MPKSSVQNVELCNLLITGRINMIVVNLIDLLLVFSFKLNQNFSLFS